ncbi:hypothetical protein NA8A_00015 [Nitratireductor indicus C115]|uniref:Uncharacterized protein n=1 Tax=Nitratireductor indicus C115 TaxID=1231190 RepID=K2P1U8_9HYPH|nr:hypothetical protein [Nitratireductor indicus]EKF44079.1 hypothetical protein NA8A_00015 [Nitratireductor indicus C115]SFQ82320.1 hypothetical protein SAMN05216176_1312 [Nitratireductor indicus]
MSDRIFTILDPWQDWVTACRDADSSREGFDPDEGNCQITTFSRSVGEVTIEEALRSMESIDDARKIMALRWSIMNMWGAMSPALQDLFLWSISSSPQTCAAIYSAHDGMTPAHYGVLWNSFKDVMTVVAARFEKDPKHG